MQASIDYPYCRGLSVGRGPINQKKDHETMQLVPLTGGMVNVHFDDESKSGDLPGKGGEAKTMSQCPENFTKGLFQI